MVNEGLFVLCILLRVCQVNGYEYMEVPQALNDCLLSPEDPSLNAIFLTEERTHTSFPVMNPIYHLTISLAALCPQCKGVPDPCIVLSFTAFSPSLS